MVSNEMLYDVNDFRVGERTESINMPLLFSVKSKSYVSNIDKRPNHNYAKREIRLKYKWNELKRGKYIHFFGKRKMQLEHWISVKRI